MNTGAYKNHVQKRRTKRRPVKLDLTPSIEAIIPKSATIMDIGAGDGRYVAWLQTAGYDATGVDGTPGIEKLSDGLIYHFDLALPAEWLGDVGPRDWGLFIEVGEHIPSEFEQKAIHNVSRFCQKGLIVSWAKPGQRGRGHVNCHTPEWVASRFAREGLLVDDEATATARKLTTRWYREKVMVMRREP